MKQNKKSGNFISRWYSRFLKPDYEIVGRVKWFTLAPLLIMLIGVIVIAFGGLNVGLDFTGGSIVKIEQFTVSSNYRTEFKTILNDVGINGNTAIISKETNKDSGAEYVTIKFQNVKGKTNEGIFEDLKTAVEGKYTGVKVSPAESISASASADLLLNALIAVFVGIILILIYVAFRFKFASGMSAIIGLIHDVFIIISLVAIFGIQINSSFIVAILTIIGYSINNTIVLFDRVRQNEKNPAYAGYSNTKLMDMSLKETFVRNINLTLTTLLPLVVLACAIFSVPAIGEFALPIIFGLFAGFYSSFFIVGPLYVQFADYSKAKKEARLKPLNSTQSAKKVK